VGNPPLLVGLLINGVAYAAIFIVVALLIRYFTNAAVWRVFLVVSLFVAAGLYVVFALRAGEGTVWIVSEVVGVAIFGGMGLVGLFGSIWWLVAGWALHPLWDVGLHYLGPGRSFAPETYTIACLSFDLLVAAYIAVAYGVGQLRGRTSGRRRRVA
jgi:hypothetical protein